jgi:protein-S-isoprenylcysteine O-methyltransferase Ste14
MGRTITRRSMTAVMILISSTIDSYSDHETSSVAMNIEIAFRVLYIIAGIAMFAIRIYYQKKVWQDRKQVEVKEGGISLFAGSIAALTTLVFGFEYIVCPGTFSFAYSIPYPSWLRWLGGFSLAGGITLLGLSHHHLGRSFHSLVVSKADRVFVETGPYRWIRHPIYTAYLVNYVSGGLLAGNLVLTFVPVIFFGVLVFMRVDKEEALLIDEFGQSYRDYMERTGRLLPRV